MSWLATFVQRLWTIRRRWLGLMAGCAFWVIWMIFGLWSTILLLVLAAVGFVIGRLLEDRYTWKDVIDKLLSERFTD